MSSSSKPRNSMGRMKHLLSSAEDADVHFLVGQKKELLHAHKLILKHASEVFEAMFRFDAQKEKTENAPAEGVVEVPDIEAAAFRVMLAFIYADDLSDLNGENAMAVLYAAKKYGVDELISLSLKKLSIPTLPNVFLAYAQACLLLLEDFARQCLLYICQNATTLFETEQFLQIDQNLLGEIFGRDQLVVCNEFEIWKAALRWADQKCRQKGILCSSKNRRAALGPALFRIRFPLMPTEEFTKYIVTSGLLTIEEFVAVYQFHCHPNCLPGLYPLKFPCHGRISDWNKPKKNRGTLAMEIDKFSEFARETKGKSRFSKAVTIKGIQWKIEAEVMLKEDCNEKCLAVYLWCTSPRNDKSWSCKCSAILRIVAQKGEAENFTGQFNGRVFNHKLNNLGFPNLITVAQLMDSDKGLYDKLEDRISIVIDVTVEEQKGAKRKLADE
ncbi:hypothetical protein niasHS_004588 [Heterodera schachtii]|uniref:BTB domain-containing protein n=1 Tax=Heterodera schachtii TaxID=97005 RepID=A0ABD2JQT7_HETSC